MLLCMREQTGDKIESEDANAAKQGHTCGLVFSFYGTSCARMCSSLSDAEAAQVALKCGRRKLHHVALHWLVVVAVAVATVAAAEPEECQPKTGVYMHQPQFHVIAPMFRRGGAFLLFVRSIAQ
jgi:hypothetical protein